MKTAALLLSTALVLPFAFSVAEPPLHAVGMPGTGGASSGHTSRSYLGVDLADVPEDQVVALRLDKNRGAQIIRVDHDGPAGKAGLCVHDIVLKINGAWINGQDQFRKLLREVTPGKMVNLQISRNGQMMDVSAQIADRAEVERRAWTDHYVVPDPGASSIVDDSPAQLSTMSRGFVSSHLTFSTPYTGLSVDALGVQLAQFFGAPDGKGLLVHEVDANSPAAFAGLHAGDVIVRANNRTMASPGDWTKLLRDAKNGPVAVIVLREKREQTITLHPGGKKRSSMEKPDCQTLIFALLSV